MKKITHPIYDEKVEEWEKYRHTFKGGKAFVEEYLVQRPSETNENFKARKNMSHCPAHAKANLNEIKNSIFTRMHQGVSREGGSTIYQSAVKGEKGGVDRKHATMTGFIGSSLLPQLLAIGKVGVWVDAPVTGGQPYYNIYKAEDILSWVDDPENPGHFTQILLRKHSFNVDPDFGFPTETKTTYRMIFKTKNGIAIIDTDEDEKVISNFTLNLKSIPFVVAELSESLLTDVADYQISLVNLDSSDIFYCWLGNTPIYTEQIDRSSEFAGLLGQAENPDLADPVIDPITKEITQQTFKRSGIQRKVGATEGVGYPLGAERPQFISPPSDPLEVSMKKQEVMRDDIRTLINLSLTTVKPRAASAESKQLDERGLEAGLSAIGLELQALENRLAELWSNYEGSKPAKINYPDEYELKSDSDRLSISEDLIRIKEKFPSQLIKIEFLKKAAETMFAGKLTNEKLEAIFKEIEDANGCTGDVESIIKDIDAGLVSAETGSGLRGYALGEVEKAQKERAERTRVSMNAQRGDEEFPEPKQRGEGTDPERNSE